jgi:hypothetical protein
MVSLRSPILNIATRNLLLVAGKSGPARHGQRADVELVNGTLDFYDTRLYGFSCRLRQNQAYRAILPGKLIFTSFKICIMPLCIYDACLEYMGKIEGRRSIVTTPE